MTPFVRTEWTLHACSHISVLRTSPCFIVIKVTRAPRPKTARYTSRTLCTRARISLSWNGKKSACKDKRIVRRVLSGNEIKSRIIGRFTESRMRKLLDSQIVRYVDLQTRKLSSPRKSVKRTSFVSSSAASRIYVLLKPQITLYIHRRNYGSYI